MISRKEYMANLPKYGTEESTKAHRAYYAQFVLPHVLKLVEFRIGLAALKASTRESFNDIPLEKWDAIWMRRAPNGMHIEPGPLVSTLLKEAGEGNSASTGTCILKEAARQLLESKSE